MTSKKGELFKKKVTGKILTNYDIFNVKNLSKKQLFKNGNTILPKFKGPDML